MSGTTSLKQGSRTAIRPLDRPGDLGWVIKAHGEVYAEEFGWDTTFEALVARIVADYAARHDPALEAAWIAEVDGERAGCVFCMTAADTEAAGKSDLAGPVAQLRILLVHPRARGLGLGGRLVDTCLEFAARASYARMKLWNNDPLQAARHVYVERGFVLTAEEPHRSFGVDLVGQTYEIDLRQSADQ